MKTNKHFSTTVAMLLLLFSVSAFATDFQFSNKKFKIKTAKAGDPVPTIGKETVSGGFMLVIGVGTPSFKFTESYPYPRNYVLNNTNTLGTQISIQIGSDFLFYKQPDKFGIGMNFSWLTIGYSNYHKDYTNYPDNFHNDPNNSIAQFNSSIDGRPIDEKFFNWDVKLVKFGPMATFALGPVALDATLDIVPVSLNIGGNKDFAYLQSGFFTNYAIGVRARYQIFTLGVEINFGKHKSVDPDASGQYTTSNFDPRFVLGFRF